jgi:hypothetical protein
MKRCVVGIVAGALVGLAGVPAPAAAQLGVRGGGSYAFATVKSGASLTNVDTGKRWGLTAGVVYGGGVIPFLGWELGAFYSQQGFSAAGQDVKLDYFQVPVLLAIKLPMLFKIYGGPVLGFQVKCETPTATTIGGEPFDCDTGTKNLDLGIRGGVSLRFIPLLSLDLSYTHGTSDVGESATLDIKNRALTATVGLNLPF